ncbi:hypothetical protein OS493_005734 [Desmophyllum pertusum]|uniref:Uncharacterized protein n=1 Tax=Desmophyllum pertusum TaxID=174260 RepID=A0A9W9YF35_9CNID|nr:hypothetical protein OS493_005734 [Desmophyllum pertusum]
MSRSKYDKAKEHFGDAAESRKVTIKGVELLDDYQTIPLNTFVTKAYKQLAIFHAIFQDILFQCSRSQEEKREIVKKFKIIVDSIDRLKTYMGTVAYLCRKSSSSFSLPDVPQFNTRTIWTKSAWRQKSWILGVLREFQQSMLYLQPAFKMHSKQ